MIDLEAIKKLCDAASKGPWGPNTYCPPYNNGWSVCAPDYGCVAERWGASDEGFQINRDDGDFIAKSRELIPALVAEVERLRTTLKIKEA